MKILYVEDNMANLFLVKRVAKMGEHDVINYIDGEDALAHIDTDQPDLVLMDIQLAGELSGLDVVKKMRDGGHKMPVVAVTAYAMLGDRERCLQSGCDDYIAKPLPIGQLTQLFEHYAQKLKDSVKPEPAATPSAVGEKDKEAAAAAPAVAESKETAVAVTDKKDDDDAGKEPSPTEPSMPSAVASSLTPAKETLSDSLDAEKHDETVPAKPHLNGTARQVS